MYKSKKNLIVVVFMTSSAIAMQLMIPYTAIAEILQSEMAFTHSQDEKYVLATLACATCVGVGGYDATNKLAFIAHFSTDNEVINNMEMLLDNISQLAKKSLEEPIQLHLRGGRIGTSSEATITAIKNLIKQRSDLPMQIASEDILGSADTSKSLLINSKTGEVGDYLRRFNPGHRTDQLKLSQLIYAGLYGKMRVAYKPVQISFSRQQLNSNNQSLVDELNGPRIEDVD